jgi:antagonist of KipI
MQVANCLVGNADNEAVIEIHFPASSFLVEQDCMLAIGGADFNPVINSEPIPLWHPILVKKNSVLQFTGVKNGARCYLSIHGGFRITGWLNSCSTHLKAGAGGYKGRALQKNDTLPFKQSKLYTPYLGAKELLILPWASDTYQEYANEKILIIPGHEWDLLNDASKKDLITATFTIDHSSDRMGYRLKGPVLSTTKKNELVSAAVSFGTIQLPPGGDPIVLMADHQTTGGYPKIAHVITAHLCRLAQVKAGENINFNMTDISTAEELMLKQKNYLAQLKHSCKLKLKDFFL